MAIQDMCPEDTAKVMAKSNQALPQTVEKYRIVFNNEN